MAAERSSGRSWEAEIIFILFLVLYLMTASPSLGWRDSPEFADATHTLGIAHPAGFPTFSLAAKVIALIPLGSIPFRVTVFAALCSAFSLYLLYSLVSRAAPSNADYRDNENCRAAAAAGTAILFGLSSTFWANSTEIEVYSLNILFLGAIIYCAIRWSDHENDSWLLAGGFIYGLAAGNHATTALYFPALLAYVIFTKPTGLLRRILLLAFFFFLGFSVYIYLPVRASTDPAFNFGNPETWERFISHVTDRKDKIHHFAGLKKDAGFFSFFYHFVSVHTPKIFWPIGLPLFLTGVWRVWKSDRPLVVALLLIIAIDIVFFIKWVTDASGFLPAFYFVAFFCGMGATHILKVSGLFSGEKGQSWKRLSYLIMIVVFVGGAWVSLPARDRSTSFLSFEAFRDDFEQLPSDAICISSVLWFHHRACQDIYRLREDVTVLGLSDFLDPDHFNPVTADLYPRIDVPDRSYSSEDGVEFLKEMLALNLNKRRRIYWEPSSVDSVFYRNLIPASDFLFRFTYEPVEEIPDTVVYSTFDRIRKKIARETETEALLKADKIDAYYIRFLSFLAEYFRLHKRAHDSVTVLTFVEEFFGPRGKDVFSPREQMFIDNEMAGSLFDLGRIDDALKRMEQALSRKPNDVVLLSNMALFYIKAGRYDEAVTKLEKVLEYYPDYPRALYLMAESYFYAGKKVNALDYYERALAKAENQATADAIKNRIKSIKGVKERNP